MTDSEPEPMDSEAAAEQDTERTLALFGVTRADIVAELRFRQAKKYEAMLKRTAAAQRAGGQRRMLRAGGEVAAVEMMIDPASYHFWGQKLGYECWDDAGFRREYLRDNPVARVKSAGRIGAATVAMTRNQAPRTAVHGRRGRWAL